MESYEIMMLVYRAAILLWVAAVGASVGSLINVLVYRLPLGLSVISPPSRCPGCGTKLGWRDNIPVLGWVLLRGKCRYCSDKISAEYPLVELLVAVLFAGLFFLWYMVPDNSVLLGIDWSSIRPEWARGDALRAGVLPVETWPEFLVLAVLMGSLVAMTLVDARTFTIPLVLTWVPTLLALIALPLHAWWVQSQGGDGFRYHAMRQPWSIPIPWTTPQAGAPSAMAGWWWIGASLGGSAGLICSVVLLKFGVLKPSFADYEEWEKKALAEAEAEKQGRAAEDGSDEDTEEAPAEDGGPEMWIQYPHARREMFREILFLGPIIALALLGGMLAVRQTGPWAYQPTFDAVVGSASSAPLALRVLAGVLMGYLIGAGLVWGVRIFGTLAFGKEAMGLGDVHLLGAVGACLGWIDSILVFFGACFVGAAWGILGIVFKGKMARALPFGPYLAVATLLVVLFKPLIEVGLARMLHVDMIDLP